jgi:uncharacterized protein
LTDAVPTASIGRWYSALAGFCAMIVDIHDLDAGEIAFDIKADPCEIGLGGGEERIAGKIELRGFVTKDGEEIQVEGVISFVADLVCSRCLERFERGFETQLRVRFVPGSIGGTAPDEVLLQKDDLDVASYDGHLIELGPSAREAVLLALPLKPLCRESCRGLCPRCGENLNRHSCDCSPADVDPRWSKLDEI